MTKVNILDKDGKSISQDDVSSMSHQIDILEIHGL